MMGAFTAALQYFGFNSVLLAPTGRAAKVISAFSGKPAFTIHKKIFTKGNAEDGGVKFFPASNTYKNTVFIVDEASMIGGESEAALGHQSSLLDMLFEYVYSGENCRMVLVGDAAQLPPVGSDLSPALNAEFLSSRFSVKLYTAELTEVARQKEDSGILYNATQLRVQLITEKFQLPQLELTADVQAVSGEELEEELNKAYNEFGEENVLVITRSNKAANLYNQHIRNRVFYRDTELSGGDRLMVVKNNYFWSGKENNNDFIANGDMATIKRIGKFENLYGMRFAECILDFSENEKLADLEVKVLLDTLFTETPALSAQQQNNFFNEVMNDYQDVLSKGKKFALLQQNSHYNALQVKFSYAVTCHKSQGGQWPCVFIDQGFLNKNNIDKNYLRWLYTAITRATKKLYLINFSPDMLLKSL